MQRTNIGDLQQHIGDTVKIQGWLQKLRDQKHVQFLIIRDRTAATQVVVEKSANPELAETISGLGQESALSITGKVVENPVVKLGGLEIQLETLDINNNAEAPLPFEPFAQPLPALDYRLDWRYMDLRRTENLVTFKAQTTLLAAMREFWVNSNFIEINTPKLMGTPSESGAELFELPYFEGKAYLAQSPQFYKQMAMAAGFEGVFEIGPAFRADPSFTSRHMTEFTSIDMEMSWVDSHEDVMAYTERLLQYGFKKVKETMGDEVKDVLGVDIIVPEVPFPRITMEEAIKILDGIGYKLPPEKKGDLDPGGERALGDYVKKEYGHEFVFLTDWPSEVRPFYHMRHPDNPNLTRSFDLLAKGLEIITGAQREHRYEVLKAQAFEKGLHEEPIRYYLDFFRYGCPSHGGFGLGLSRLSMVLLGITNVRESTFLFRGPNRLHP